MKGAAQAQGVFPTTHVSCFPGGFLIAAPGGKLACGSDIRQCPVISRQKICGNIVYVRKNTPVLARRPIQCPERKNK